MAIARNNVMCDIYIGSGAGRLFLEELDTAEHSIKIVSPYLSPSIIKKLIDYKNNKNLDVQLITVDNLEDFYGDYDKNIHKLIQQKRHTDGEMEKKRNKFLKYEKILKYFSWITLLSFSTLYYLGKVPLSFSLIPISALVTKWLIGNINSNMRIYHYSYHQLFPFVVYANTYSNTFIHSKIYIIDDKIAYLGSLNFTKSAAKENHETRIRTEDKKALEGIKVEFENLMENKYNLPYLNIEEWGKLLYSEPIN